VRRFCFTISRPPGFRCICYTSGNIRLGMHAALWLDWIKDESAQQPREHMLQLFERAVADYLCMRTPSCMVRLHVPCGTVQMPSGPFAAAVPLWLHYCRYAMAEVDPEADVDPKVVRRVRDVFEAALRAAGLHATQVRPRAICIVKCQVRLVHGSAVSCRAGRNAIVGSVCLGRCCE
jgi:hypothetical protein